MLKDLLYTGLGGALLVRERVEKELEKLREKGKLSKEEMQKILQEAKGRGEEEEARVKEEIKRVLKEVIEELGLATKADIDALKDQLKK